MKVGRKWIASLATLAVCSLALKVLYSHPVDYVAQWPQFRDRILAELGHAGFDTITMFDDGVVVGSKASCTAYFYHSRPEGGDEPLRKKQLDQLGELVFWYRGNIYKERPVIAPLLSRNINRVSSSLGGNVEYFPVFGVFVSGDCDAHTLENLRIDVLD